ncbi:hypothetical protein ACEWY4_021404 [Coilia grayii]|uniref:Myopalladin n=1 Tax=Coilia grayii TaxID=363190 RepID=A0ABD1JC25_9TELE
MDQPTSLSQLLRESYLAEARARHRHGETGESDPSSSRRLLYGSLKGKAEDSGTREDSQFPDLSAFLSQEELDKSVNLARQAIGHEPHENERAEAKSSQISPPAASAMPSPTVKPPTEKTETVPLAQSYTPNRQPTLQNAASHDSVIRNNRAPREPSQDFKRPVRNTPYGNEPQSKKEFLNKAADFIEELSSLFKANSSKRIRPRACKAHRSRYQNKGQPDGPTTFGLNAAEERERPVRSFDADQPEALCEELPQQEVEMVAQEMFVPGCGPVEEAEGERERESEAGADVIMAEAVAENPALLEAQVPEEPLYEPPHFIQKLKSREVPEGSKVRLDCIVRGLPAPEVRWFCEGKELENSPDIQILTNGELHSLIIAEAFEEDTGRYSCFASNFYGTDSTSAEIYIEGASSSESEAEHNFEHLAQLQKKAAKSKAALPSVSSSKANAFVEDSAPATLATVCPEAAPPPEDPVQPDTSESLCPPASTQVLFTPPPTAQVTSPPASNQVLFTPPPTAQVTSAPASNQVLFTPPPTAQVTSAPASNQVLFTPPPTAQVTSAPASNQVLFTPPPIAQVTSAPASNQVLFTPPPTAQVTSAPASNQVLFTPPPTAQVTSAPASNQVLFTPPPIAQVTSPPASNQVLFTPPPVAQVPPPLLTPQLEPAPLLAPDLSSTPAPLQEIPPEPFSLAQPAVTQVLSALVDSGPPSLPPLGISTSPPSLAIYVPPPPPLSIPEETVAPLAQAPPASSLPPLVLSTQSNVLEGQNGGSYPQGLDGRPIMAAPVFTKSLQDLLALEGQLVVLECRVKGVPSPKVEWYREGTLIEDSPDFRILQKKPRSMAESEEICTLVIAEVFPEDSGTFTCTASNKYGTVSSIAALKVKDPPASCLKSRPEGVLVNHREPRSASRVGLRVHFKLPEDEEEEEDSEDGSGSHEDLYPAHKEPPPVLAKPKLDPVQLQLLHNQVLLEQQQEGSPQGPERPEPSPWSSRSLPDTPAPPLSTPLTDSCAPTTHAPVTARSAPGPVPAPAHLVDSRPDPQISPAAPPVNTTLSPMMPRVASTSVPPAVSMPAPPAPKLAAAPVNQMSPMNMAGMGMATAPLSHMAMVPPPQMAPMTAPAPLSMAPPPTSTPRPLSTTFMPVVSSPPPPPVPKFMTAPTPQMSMAPSSPPSISSSMINIAPLTPMSPVLPKAPVVPLSSPPAPVQVPVPPVVPVQAPAPQPPLPPPVSTILSTINNSQNFSYSRPKQFIAAQTLSPVRSPSPTESPVPMLHELAAELNQKLARETSSPLSPTSSVSSFPTSPRVFHTRVLEPANSPPAYVSSPTLVPPAFVNSPLLRAQSPPQASSPTSSSSTPSPIQNPVAFLSSVLPSLHSLPSTNAMGLPKRAPVVPQSILRKTNRSQRLPSDEDIRESKETLIHDIEKKLRFKEDTIRQGPQNLPYEGKAASRPLGPNIPTATVINYDEEYKVSNFEQRLMSEIEFRLERTPVEESDDEVQHDEIPTGKCIAPLFDKKLKNYRATEGAPVTFTCKVVGIPIPKVYWFKDGKQILRKNDHYKKIREGDGTCALYIASATNDDDGNYTVMAANPQGRMSCSGHLIVQTGPVRNRPVIHSQRVRARVQEVEEGEPIQERFFRPHFLQAPGDMVAHEGRLCRLDCKVSGLPNPEIMWLINGRPIYPDYHHRMLVRENGIHSLIIDPLTQNDGGTYTCIASNKAGQSSFCLELRVVEKETKHPPHFVEKLQNTGIAEGIPVRLECRVVGMPPPTIFWKKDNETIPQSKDRVSMHQDATGYVCLLIQPTRKEDAGWYTVSAKNEAGIISCTARLDIYASAAIFN